jgi:hypothetical protein
VTFSLAIYVCFSCGCGSKFTAMAQWLCLVIAICSSVALAATTLVTQLSKGTWGDFMESHGREVVVALCMLCQIAFLSRLFIQNSD